MPRWTSLLVSDGTPFTLRKEVRAGFTTFLTMSYILVVNPAILGQAIDVEGRDLTASLMAATAIAAAIGCFAMAFLAKYPFALAPGMGLNAYFTFTLVLGQGIAWQTALGAVFLSGLLFFVISIFGLRAAITRIFPKPVIIATSAGIGFFLALLGLTQADILVDHPATLISLGDLSSAKPLVAMLGLLVTAVLMVRKVPGAMLIGILTVAFVCDIFSLAVFGEGEQFSGSFQMIQWPAMPEFVAFELDISGALNLGFLGIVFSFFFVDFFDTAGTLMGLGRRAGYLKNDQLPRANQAYTADAIATMAGACLGTSTTTTYIESASGIEDGGKTGIVALVTGLLFLSSLVFWPLVRAIPPVATSAALILVGCSMMRSMTFLNWDDSSDVIPALLTVVLIPLTFSIATGISLGILAFVAVKGLGGRLKSLNWGLLVLAILLVLRFIYLAE